MKIFFFLFFCFFISFLFILLLFFFSFSVILENFCKSSSFECGFSSISMLGSVFSMPFFVISIMFLLFDVEIIVLCFYPLFGCGSYCLSYFTYFVSFVILFSTLFEWLKGVLNWL